MKKEKKERPEGNWNDCPLGLFYIIGNYAIAL